MTAYEKKAVDGLLLDTLSDNKKEDGIMKDKEIEVTGCGEPSYWYADRIGERFRIISENEGWYMGDFTVDGLKESGIAYHIGKEDCRVVEREKRATANRKRRIRIATLESVQKCDFMDGVSFLHIEWNYEYDCRVFYVSHPKLGEVPERESCETFWVEQAKERFPFLFKKGFKTYEECVFGEEKKQITASTDLNPESEKDLFGLKEKEEEYPNPEPVMGRRKGFEDTGPIPGMLY